MEVENEDFDDVLYPFDPERCAFAGDTFFYPSNLITNSIISALQAKNFERAVELINKGKELNLTDNRGFTCLHVAVQVGNLDILNLLLNQETINKDAQSYQGQTPLLLGLKENASDCIVLKLIEHGCSINRANLEQETPLHLAVKRKSITVAQTLIQKGANINAKDSDGYTPLHEAVASCNYEPVCLLLYYNASVNERSYYDRVTPFMLSLHSKNDPGISAVLIDYVTNFNAADSDGCTTLHLALSSRSKLVEEIVLRGANVNLDMHCILLTLHYRDSSVFKLIWSQLDHDMLFESYPQFLVKYIAHARFQPRDFVECTYLILNSRYANKLIRNVTFETRIESVFPRLCKKCDKLSVNHIDKVRLIYHLLSMGCPVNFHSVHYIYLLCGFNEELEAVFKTNVEVCNSVELFSISILPYFICYNYDRPERVLLDMLQAGLTKRSRCFFDNVLQYLKFYTPNVETRDKWRDDWLRDDEKKKVLKDEIKKRSVPCLAELSRNAVRSFIYKKFPRKNVSGPYTAINSLGVPQAVKDILLLKRPLYL